MSPFATVGPRLIERGYCVIPIAPGTKFPGEMRRGQWRPKVGWQDYAQRQPTRFEMQIWGTWLGAGIGLVAGPASGHVVGVDMDTDDPIIRGAILGVLPTTSVVKRGQKGETRIFRGPAIVRSKSWPGICDLIGPGRQTVLPPTLHPTTGQPYVWLGPDTLENTAPAELPELLPEHIEAIDEALKPFGYVKEEFSEPERGPTAFECTDKRGREHSLGALHGCADELANAAPGGRNAKLNAVTFKLARKAGRGWLTEDEIGEAMWGACLHNGLIADDGPHAFRATFWSALRAGLQRPAPDPRERNSTINPQFTAGLRPRTI